MRRQNDHSSPSSLSQSSHRSPDSQWMYQCLYQSMERMRGHIHHLHRFDIWMVSCVITTILLTRREGFPTFLGKMGTWIGWGNTPERFHIHYNLHKGLHLPWKYQNKTTKQYIICFHFDISWKLWIDIMWVWMIKMYSFIYKVPSEKYKMWT